jgi:hypothetical protein
MGGGICKVSNGAGAMAEESISSSLLVDTETESSQASPAKPEQSEITPRTNQLMVGIAETPIPGSLHSLSHKYYCPLCMIYFSRILRTPCCGHHICGTCCLTYLSSKGLEADDISTVMTNSQLVATLECPNCTSPGFAPQILSDEAAARNYQNTPGNFSRSNIASSNFSPVKAGDSFDTLRKKLVPLNPKTEEKGEDDENTEISPSRLFAEKESFPVSFGPAPSSGELWTSVVKSYVDELVFKATSNFVATGSSLWQSC